jgi:hypothetical protein
MSYDLNLCKSAFEGVGGIIFLAEMNNLLHVTPPVSLSNSKG